MERHYLHEHGVTGQGGMALSYKRVGLDYVLGRNSLLRVERQWNQLPPEAVNAPSLEVFKAQMDGTLSNLI